MLTASRIFVISLPYCCLLSFAVLLNEKMEQDGDDAPLNTSTHNQKNFIKTSESCIDLLEPSPDGT